ncbi:MAG TPA: peptidoglycan editing factor PgeF [Betaproteobacteria bacterium]|nr:peptidoglycan editing factor PgeF [Betaproteobacteria bacterium]
MIDESDLIRPHWPCSPRVRALATTRRGGGSAAPYGTLNLADHVGDDPARVRENRARLRRFLPAEPVWLRQVHQLTVVDADYAVGAPEGDAAVARRAGTVCAVLTADCLPLLLCDQDGTVVAAAHAGWRGLAAGVIEQTLAAMNVPSASVRAWLGPAIGPAAFVVGEDVRRQFIGQDSAAAQAFAPHDGKWLADLYALARLRLARQGVTAVFGGGDCTFGNPERFYSYRRDGVTGRMASLIWLA